VDDRSNVTDRDRSNVLDDLSGSRVRASVGTAALAAQSNVTSLGFSDSGKVGNFSFVNFGSIDDNSRSNWNSFDGQSFTGLSFGNSGKVSELGLSYLRGISDGSGTNENGSSTGQRPLRQEVGEDTESTLTSGIVDDNLLTVGVDVRVVTDLVSHGVTEVGSGLVSGDVAETGLAEFILRVEFAEDRRRNGDRSSVMNNRQRGRQSVNDRQRSGRRVNSWKMMNNRQRSRKRCGQSVEDRSYMADDRERSNYRNLMTEDGCVLFDNFNRWRRAVRFRAVRASVARNHQTNEQKHDSRLHIDSLVNERAAAKFASAF